MSFTDSLSRLFAAISNSFLETLSKPDIISKNIRYPRLNNLLSLSSIGKIPALV